MSVMGRFISPGRKFVSFPGVQARALLLTCLNYEGTDYIALPLRGQAPHRLPIARGSRLASGLIAGFDWVDKAGAHSETVAKLYGVSKWSVEEAQIWPR